MPRKLLLFAVIAVAGSMLALWLLTRDKSSESSASPSADKPVVAETDTRRDRTQPSLAGENHGANDEQPREYDVRDPNRGNSKTTDPNRPNATTVESVPRGSSAPATDPPLEYTLPDGRIVRDHRPPDQRKPLEVPPSTQPPGGRRIPPELTGLYSDQIQAAMKECAKAVPKSALGDKPRLEGQIIIAIKAGQGSITSGVFKLTNFTNPSIADSTKQCIEQKAMSVKVPAPGEQDLDSYSINMSFLFL
jgi:hypothetical protein